MKKWLIISIVVVVIVISALCLLLSKNNKSLGCANLYETCGGGIQGSNGESNQVSCCSGLTCKGIEMGICVSESDCAKAGEASNSPPVDPAYYWEKQCCGNFVEISNCVDYEPDNQYSNSNGCLLKTGCGNICSDCGNDICESWENKCNCPKDCK